VDRLIRQKQVAVKDVCGGVGTGENGVCPSAVLLSPWSGRATSKRIRGTRFDGGDSFVGNSTTLSLDTLVV
jgi:hypothetical protein